MTVTPQVRRSRRIRAARAAQIAAAALVLGLAPLTPVSAQPGVHYQHQSTTIPGAIGQWQLRRGGPLAGYFQPVEIRAPEGAMVSMADGGTFDDERPTPRRAGLMVAPVYRIKVTQIPFREGEEVFPTIEIIDRTYPPPGLTDQYPIPIELTLADLNLALDGKFVTRVIYVEDPNYALPTPQGRDAQPWLEAPIGSNPLQVADELGRPVAILRMGGRVPDQGEVYEQFLFGSPPFEEIAPPSETAEPLKREIQPVSARQVLSGMPRSNRLR
jgi:hypothetical protein